MKFLLYEIIPRVGFNLTTGRMFDIPDLNQQISHCRSCNSARKVCIDENFVSSLFKPDAALPNVQ